MKSLSKTLFITLAATLFCTAVEADPNNHINGSPKANFSTNELTIPCVLVQNSSTDADGKFFDVMLKRRGNSWNYELTTADAEDQAMCQRIADYASTQESGGTATPQIVATCVATADRSKISVQGKNLTAGGYHTTVSSGTNSADSSTKTADTTGAVAFAFDSDAAAVTAGSQSISATFITGSSVTAKLFAGSSTTPLLTSTVACSATL